MPEPTEVYAGMILDSGDVGIRVLIKLCHGILDGKGMPEDWATRVKVGTHFSEEFEVNVGVHQGSVLSPLLFAIVVDVVKNGTKEGMLQEILYVDDIVLIAESMAELQEKFYGWKSALESKGLKVNLRKINVMVSELVSVRPSSKKDPCGICGRKPMLNAVLCKSCENWIHGRPITRAKIKMVTNRFAIDFKCLKSISYPFNLCTCNRSSMYQISTRFT